MKNSYYNTTNETGQTLKDREEKALSQEAKILEIWRTTPKLELTPERFELIIYNSPLTSIRRAFTNLQEAGMIEKTGRYAPGKYGNRVNTWRLI